MDLAFRVRAALTENLSLKLISLLFALVLYSVVHGSQEAQRSIKLNAVALLPPSSNRELMTTLPDKINATIRGPKSTLDDLNADDLGSVQLDLHTGTETHLAIDPSMIPVPPGLHVEQIDPPVIDVEWEDVIVRDVPVQVGVVGSPAPGYVVKGAPVADPATVRVQGPRSRVAVVQYVRADAFDVTGLTEGKYTRTLGVDHPPERIKLDMPSVSATVEIAREVVERPFTRVPIAVVGHANAKAQPSEVDVRLSCPADVARSLRPEQVVPRVQITAPSDHGSDVLPVQVGVDQCEVHITPPTVVVRW